jgi:hypothetical protein
MHASTPEPDMDWYLNLSRDRGTTPRCPFASVERCPRYYQSLSLLGDAGSTKIAPDEDDRLKAIWEKSDLWPKTAEGGTSIFGDGRRTSSFSNFCPEVSYDRFHLFASGLYRHADEIDIESAHRELSRAGVPGTHWRWLWAAISPMHFTECPLYSPLTHGDGLPAVTGADEKESKQVRALEEKPAELVTLKPNFHGVSVDLKEPERITLVERLKLLESRLPVEEAKSRLRQAFIHKAFSQEPLFALSYDESDIDWTTGCVKIPRKRDRFWPTFVRAEFNAYFFKEELEDYVKVKATGGSKRSDHLINGEVLMPPPMSVERRRLVLASTSILKALGHNGFDRMLLELGVPEDVGTGSGLLVRTTSLGRFVLTNPDAKEYQGGLLSDAIIKRAQQLRQRGVMQNLSEDDVAEYEEALASDSGQPAPLAAGEVASRSAGPDAGQPHQASSVTARRPKARA